MDDNLINDYILNTKALLYLYAENKITIDDAVTQLHFYTSTCPKARSLIAHGSDLDLRLHAVEQRQLEIGFDLSRVERFGFMERIDGINQRLVSINSFGQVVVSGYPELGKSIFTSVEGLSRFAITLRLITELVNQNYLGEYLDPKPLGEIVDFSVHLKLNDGERCISRWVFGSLSESPPTVVIHLIEEAHRLATRVIDKFKRQD